MNTTILCPLAEPQIEALIDWHLQEADRYKDAPYRGRSFWARVRDEHLRDAADLRRRLIDAQDRTETNT